MKTLNLVVKILIPVALFVIANINSALLANSIAGVMTVLVIGSYVIEGFNKPKI